MVGLNLQTGLYFSLSDSLTLVWKRGNNTATVRRSWPGGSSLQAPKATWKKAMKWQVSILLHCLCFNRSWGALQLLSQIVRDFLWFWVSWPGWVNDLNKTCASPRLLPMSLPGTAASAAGPRSCEIRFEPFTAPLTNCLSSSPAEGKLHLEGCLRPSCHRFR